MLSNWLTGRTDEIFTGTDSTGTANFMTDALGSTMLLTNSSGSTIAQYAYQPFGNATVTSGSSTNEFQFTGRENDGTGLFFNRGRYYDPLFQRFVSEDPIGWKGGANLFAYVGNNPTNLTDPTGKYADESCWEASGIGLIYRTGAAAGIAEAQGYVNTIFTADPYLWADEYYLFAVDKNGAGIVLTAAPAVTVYGESIAGFFEGVDYALTALAFGCLLLNNPPV